MRILKSFLLPASALAMMVAGCLSTDSPSAPDKKPDSPKDTTKSPVDTSKPPVDTGAYSNKVGLTSLYLRPQWAVLRVSGDSIRFVLAEPPKGRYWTGYNIHAGGLADLGVNAPYEEVRQTDTGAFLLSVSAHPLALWARTVPNLPRWQMDPPETRIASLVNRGTYKFDSPEWRSEWMSNLGKRGAAGQGTWVSDGYYDRKAMTHFALVYFDRAARFTENYTLCGKAIKAEALIPKAGVFALAVTYPEMHLIGGPLALSKDLVHYQQQIELTTDSLIPDLRACRAPTRSLANPRMVGTWKGLTDSSRLKRAEFLAGGHFRLHLVDSLGQDSLITGMYMADSGKVQMQVPLKFHWRLDRSVEGDSLPIPFYGTVLVKESDSLGYSNRIKPLQTSKFITEPQTPLDIAWSDGKIWISSGGSYPTRERLILADTATHIPFFHRDTLAVANSGGVTLDGDGNLWVAKQNMAVQVDTATGTTLRTVLFPPMSGNQNHIVSLSHDKGRIYAVFSPDYDGADLQSFSIADGKVLNHGRIHSNPAGAFCVRDGQLWYARYNFIHVRKLDEARAHTTYELMEFFNITALEVAGDAIWAIRESMDPTGAAHPDLVKLGPL